MTVETMADKLITALKKRGLWTEKIIKAYKQAYKSHRNQLRDSGKNYFYTHIVPVTMDLLVSLKRTKKIMLNIITLSLLHDVLEDDPTVTEEDIKKSFGVNILNNLKVLTKPKYYNTENLTDEQKFLENKKIFNKVQNSSFAVKIVKLSDRFNNISALDFLKVLKPEKYYRYLKEGYELVLPLAKKTSPSYYKKIKAVLDTLN